ncbi:kin of IRRE-like protein 3 [Acanthaster planci]|uniref:Kin of IRRE-like protein 3 n=1 Tax=Acanthaster planci TaxID=133434 RepID=A0A8B8A0B3_ACAPL|nr:kin of IRRE-like protein 3 [Acanthaster planci]
MARPVTSTFGVFRHRRCQLVQNLLLVVAVMIVHNMLATHHVWAAQSFQEEPSDTAVVIGEAVVVLKCIIAEKSGELIWFKGEEYIASDMDLTISKYPRYSFEGNTSLGEYNLQIDNAILEDDGEYHCQVTATTDNPVIASRRARLIIQRIPSMMTLRPSDPILSVVVGVPTNLTCEATSANPAAQIKWLRGGSELSATYQRTWKAGDPSGKLMNAASALKVYPALADHSIVYECQVSHMAMATPRTLGITLDVQHAPVVVVEASHTPIREDTPVIFRCVVDANPRRVSYLWAKNGEPISGAEDNQVELVITKEDHMASIACTAENTIGSVTGSLTTPVLYGPRFLEVPVSVSVDEEGPAQMSCSADGNPTPTIKWTRLGSRATLSTMHILQFDLVRESDVGTYVCIATVPGFEPIMSYGRVDINAIPEIKSPSQQTAKLDGKATLECFTDTKPDPYLAMWTWDDQQLEEGTVGRFTATKREANGGVLSELVIDGVTPADFGVYNCTMMNEVGDVSLLITLIQQDLDLIVWIIIAVIGTSAVIFVLTIIVMFYCRRKWQRRKKATSLNKGKVQLEIVRKLTTDDDDQRTNSDSYSYNATPPSTPGKPRYAEPYEFTRGRRDSFDDPHYRAPRRQSDGYSYDGNHPDRYPDRYAENEYSEPIVRRKVDDDRVSYHSDRSEDYGRRDHGDSRYDDAMYDDEVKQYNSKDPRYADDTPYDDQSYGNRSYEDSEERSHGDRRYDDGYSYEDSSRRYSYTGSEGGSDASQVARNKLATNV